jgi:hypothetical protein
MKSRRIALLAFVAAVLLSPVFNVEACGPFFEDEVFVNRSAPDDPHAFLQGHLGILQDHFDSNDYAVAYRYLIGGKLSAAEGNTDTPPPPAQPAAGRQVASRASALPSARRPRCQTGDLPHRLLRRHRL